MNAQDLSAKLILWLDQGIDVVTGWLVSPAAWSQCGLLALAFAVAVVAARRITPLLTQVLTPPTPEGTLARIRLFLLSLTPGAGIDIPFPHRVVELRQAAP